MVYGVWCVVFGVTKRMGSTRRWVDGCRVIVSDGVFSEKVQVQVILLTAFHLHMLDAQAAAADLREKHGWGGGMGAAADV